MKWELIAEDEAAPMIHPVAYLYVSANKLEKIVGTNGTTSIGPFESKKFRYGLVVEAYTRFSRIVLKKFEEPGFLDTVKKQSIKTAEELRNYVLSLEEILPPSSNEEIVQIYRKLFDLWTDMNAWGHVVNCLDFHHNMLTNRILAFLKEKFKEPLEVFSILTNPLMLTPTSQQDVDFLHLLKKIQENEELKKLFQKGVESILAELPKFEELNELLEKHAREYNWIYYHYSGPTILDKKYFVATLKDAVNSVDAQSEIEKIEERNNKIREQQKKYVERLDEKEKYWIEVAKSAVYLKAMRKDIVFFASRYSDILFKEIATRLGISKWDARFLTIDEIEEAFRKGKIDEKLIKQRESFSIWIVGKNGIRVLSGEDAKEFKDRNIVRERVQQVEELKGTPASVGKVKGIVKLIRSVDDIKKMEDGDILVSPATNPNLMPAIKKAAAIVTDEGGLTCHAAIVSREFGIPCIVGTKVATKALKDGDEVEVDADKGIVKILSSK